MIACIFKFVSILNSFISSSFEYIMFIPPQIVNHKCTGMEVIPFKGTSLQ
jgi:hypothetical protein